MIRDAQIELDIEADDKVRRLPSRSPVSRLRRAQWQLCSRSVLPVLDYDYDNDNAASIVQITRIKEKVEEQSGVPPQQQRLIHAGRQL
jgi:hypothetical protein